MTIPAELAFPAHLTLSALQAHMKAMCAHFKWDTIGPEQKFLLLTEEVGELAKAMRKMLKLLDEQNNPDKPVWDDPARRANLAEEFSDVLSYVLDLANMFDIDLDAAYRAKMAENFKRDWA